MQKKDCTGLWLRKAAEKEKEGQCSATLLPCELHVEAGGLTESFPWIHKHKCSSIIATVSIPQCNISTVNHLN